jgi:hypothetical protein
MFGGGHSVAPDRSRASAPAAERRSPSAGETSRLWRKDERIAWSIRGGCHEASPTHRSRGHRGRAESDLRRAPRQRSRLPTERCPACSPRRARPQPRDGQRRQAVSEVAETSSPLTPRSSGFDQASAHPRCCQLRARTSPEVTAAVVRSSARYATPARPRDSGSRVALGLLSLRAHHAGGCFAPSKRRTSFEDREAADAGSIPAASIVGFKPKNNGELAIEPPVKRSQTA